MEIIVRIFFIKLLLIITKQKKTTVTIQFFNDKTNNDKLQKIFNYLIKKIKIYYDIIALVQISLIPSRIHS